jgi:hypothetical protein
MMSNPLMEVILTRYKAYHVLSSDARFLGKFRAGRVIPGQARNENKRSHISDIASIIFLK